MKAGHGSHPLGTHGWLRLLVAAALVLILVLTLEAGPSAGASPTVCRVQNTVTSKTYAALQAAVKAAKPGGTLIVKGICRGTTVIDRDLVIEGIKIKFTGGPVLSGRGKARVLTIKPGVIVTIRGLDIQNGRATRVEDGGGIYNKGTLTLRDVAVWLNEARRGGGIFNAGVLRMLEASRVYANDYVGWRRIPSMAGAGIYNTGRLTLDATARIERNAVVNEGTLRMEGASRIIDTVLNRGTMLMGGTARLVDDGLADPLTSFVLNIGTLVMNDASRIEWHGQYPPPYFQTNGPGAGVHNIGTLTMNDTASIHHNRAGPPAPGQPGRGGGVYNAGTVTMTGTSTIHSNEALPDENGVPGLGGGLYNASGGTLVGVTCGPGGNVTGNTPDDCYVE